MLYAIALLIATAVGSLVLLAFRALPSRSRAMERRLVELAQLGGGMVATERRRRAARRERWEGLLQALGEKADTESTNAQGVRQRLIYAGFRQPGALPLFLGVRLALPIVLASVLSLITVSVGAEPAVGWIAAAMGGVVGYIAPSFWLDSRVNARVTEIQLALPDALDLLVVCVEAGLGMNQAILRVAEEIEPVSIAMGEELGLVNLEIRAGTPRVEALRHLGERSGVDDLRALTTMLIQTDRFGTSVADALRVQADTLRTRRKQRAEEAAAKTAIKMLFPLVVFIFPSLFIVILGPAMIQILRTLVFQEPGP